MVLKEDVFVRYMLSYKIQPEDLNNNDKFHLPPTTTFTNCQFVKIQSNKNVYFTFYEEKQMSVLLETKKGCYKHTTVTKCFTINLI